MVDIREKFVGMAIPFIVSFVVVVVLVLFWAPLTPLVEGIPLGLWMFFDAGFYQFWAFYGGFILITTLVIAFAVKSRFKRRD